MAVNTISVYVLY